VGSHYGISKFCGRYLTRISAKLASDLEENIAAQTVFDDNYWKRRLIANFIPVHCGKFMSGLTWKQLYFETWIQKVARLIVCFHTCACAVLRGSAYFETCKLACINMFSVGFKVEEIRKVMAMISACQDNVFELEVRSVPPDE